MEESKAISPEVKGILDIIKKQAEQYNEAFQTFAKQSNQHDRLVENLRNLHNNYKLELSEEAAKFKRTADTVIGMLKNENARTVKLSLKLQDLHELQDKFEELNTRFISVVKEGQEYITHLEDYIGEFRGRAETELNQTIDQVKDQIEDKITKASEKSEMKIALRQGQIEGNIINFDRKLKSLAEREKLDVLHLTNELDQINVQLNNIIDSNISGSGANDSSMEYIAEVKYIIFEKIDTLEAKFKALEDDMQKPLEEIAEKSSDAANTKYRLNQILSRLLSLEDVTGSQSNKSNASLTLAVLAIISALIAILLGIFK